MRARYYTTNRGRRIRLAVPRTPSDVLQMRIAQKYTPAVHPLSTGDRRRAQASQQPETGEVEE